MQLSDDLGETWYNYKEIDYCVNPGMWHDYPVPYWKENMLHLTYRSGIKNFSVPKNPWEYTDVRYKRFLLQEIIS